MLFRHYKGGLYYVEGLNEIIRLDQPFDHMPQHTETHEFLVIYSSCLTGKIWARPMKMFFSTVEVDGEEIRRFEPVGASDDSVDLLNKFIDRVFSEIL